MQLQSAKQVWDAVLGDLQLQITRPSYETWLKDTIGLEYIDGELVVGAPNMFVAEMLEQRMYTLISQVLERVASQQVDVRFTVLRSDSTYHAPGEEAPTPDPTESRSVVDSKDGHQVLHVSPPSASNGGIRLNSRYTFSSFIVGKSNELAHAAAAAVSEKPGVTYNPLFIYSGVGLGKTHLLHAIGQRLLSSGLGLIYVTAEEFTNEYIKAIREGKTEEFRIRYRNAYALLVDDIQFIIGKEQTQEGFFHTFNALHMAARQIVITSDRPVTSLTLLEDRVRSRLAGGLIADIQSPDLETRLAILRARADESGQRFPPEVLQFLAERVHQNIRELEGCLNRVAALAHLTDRPVTLELARTAITDTLRSPNRRRITEDAVLDAVTSYFGVDDELLKGRRRDKHTALARQVAMYLLREETGLPLTTIGKLLGGKDHTTVMHACNRVSQQVTLDGHLRQDVTNIREALLKT